jgi:hypothetical protein
MPPLLVAVVAIGILLWAALQSRHSSIAVTDQEVSAGMVTIKRVFLTSEGFVAIHRSDASGELVRTSSIGHAPLDSGVHVNVKVPLTESVTGKLFAVVHRDTQADGHYEFGDGDKDPIALVNGKPVAGAFLVQ